MSNACGAALSLAEEGAASPPQKGNEPMVAVVTAPYQGTVAALAYQNPALGTANTSSGVLVTAGQFARSVTISTLPTSTTNVWLNPSGQSAIAGSGACVLAGGGSYTFGGAEAPMPTANITAITDGAAAQTVTIVGG
jgi:hypothetical protein